MRAVRAGITRVLFPALSAKPEALLPVLDTCAQFTLVLRVEFDGANGRDRIELTRLGEEGAQTVYVARTEHTHGDVVVEPFYAGEVTKDLADLF